MFVKRLRFFIFVVRLAVCQGKSNKPTIVITKDFRIYLANFTTEEVVHEQGELFAFNTGAFEVKIIKGSLEMFNINC